MIRGFAKEEDQEEVPMVPQRAYLPPGVSNFVTPAGTRKKKRVCPFSLRQQQLPQQMAIVYKIWQSGTR